MNQKKNEKIRFKSIELKYGIIEIYYFKYISEDIQIIADQLLNIKSRNGEI